MPDSRIYFQSFTGILFLLCLTLFATPTAAGTRVVGWGTPNAGALAVPPTLTNAVEIACGASWGLALTDQDKLVEWGDVSGNMGIRWEKPMPAGLQGICRIAASYGDGAVVMDNGAAVGWTRYTIYNLIGFPDTLRNVAQTYSIGNLTILVIGDGRVFEIGQHTGGRLHEFQGLTDFAEVTGWQDRIVGRRKDGTVLIWEHAGSIGMPPPSTNIPPQATNIVSVTAGPFHNLALRSDGIVIAWGANDFGQCNVPESVVGAVAIAAGQNHSAALLADGSVVCWGDGQNGQTNVPASLRGVVSISALADVTLTLVDDEVKAGLPVLVGPPAAVITPGQAFELRVKTFNAPHTVVVEGLPAGLHYDPARQAIVGKSVELGSFPVTLRAESPHGSTARGLLLKVPQPVPQIVNPPVQQLTVGVESVWKLNAYNGPNSWIVEDLPAGLALDAATGAIRGTPRQMGDYPVRLRAINASGTNEMTVIARVSTLAIWPSVVVETAENQIPAGLGAVVQGAIGGELHTLVLQSDGTARAWGQNHDGQINVPQGLSGVKQLAAGFWHSLALRNDGSIVGWGQNTGGQASGFPGGHWEQISGAYKYSFAVNDTGEVTAQGDFTDRRELWPVRFPAPVRMISPGIYHGLALLIDGTVFGWGGNGFGQTSVPPRLNDAVQVAAGEEFSVALRSNGRVVAWGRGDGGETSVPENLGDVAMVAAGYKHAIALREDGSVAIWGLNHPEDTLVNRLRRVRWIAGDGSVLRFVAVRAPGDDEVTVLRPPRATTVRSMRQERVQFSVGAVGIAPLSFQWQFGGMDLPGETNRWLNVERVAACHLGTYSVRISDGHSQTVASAELQADGPQPPPAPLELDEFFQLGICVSVATKGGRLTGVQVSEDMVQWRDLLLLLPPTPERVERFVDPVSSDLRQRFYRLTWKD